MQIDLDDRTESLVKADYDLIESLLAFVAEAEDLPSHAEVSVSIVSDEEIKALNKSYRGKDDVTDVLSFALQDDASLMFAPDNTQHPLLLGDIIISLRRTQEQAEAYNHSFQRELGFLVVHGLLHLLGYDHLTADDEQAMFKKQHELLAKYGLKR